MIFFQRLYSKCTENTLPKKLFRGLGTSKYENT